MDNNIEIETSLLDIHAEPAFPRGLVDGALQSPGRTEILAPNVDIRFVTADGVCGDEGAFDQRVRVALQDVAVLERSRLALVRVHHQILRFGGLLRDKRPLLAGRES